MWSVKTVSVSQSSMHMLRTSCSGFHNAICVYYIGVCVYIHIFVKI